MVCVGLNYRTHIQEMGRDLPDHPTLFSKFADTLIGAGDEIVRPPETDEFDWEVELAVVIGSPVRRADVRAGRGRDRRLHRPQRHHLPRLAVPHPRVAAGQELGQQHPGRPATSSPPTSCPAAYARSWPSGSSVDGEVMQSDTTADLLFDPVALVQYVSTMVRLNPGDIIATGTPGGVGHARNPKRYLVGGETVVAEIEGIGRLENVVVKEEAR